MTLSMVFTLIERMGIVVVLTFLVMNIPYFRQKLDQSVDYWILASYSVAFGVFGIFGNYVSLVIRDNDVYTMFTLSRLLEGDILLPMSIVTVVIAGIVGGPIIGLGSGFITGTHIIWAGGTMVAWSVAFSLLLIGLITGLVAVRFLQKRTVTPMLSMLLGLMASVIFLLSIFIWVRPLNEAVLVVSDLGLPLLAVNSIALMILSMMLKTTMGEKEQEIATRTGKAFQISEQALGYLKEGLTEKSARSLAELFLKELRIESATITDTQKVLAYMEKNQGHIQSTIPDPLQIPIVKEAMNTSTLKVFKDRQQPIIVIPFNRLRQVAGVIILKCKSLEETQSVEIALVEGLGKLISYQLSLLETEKLRVLLKDTELRSLQAQINPHFLFNTLNTIVSLIRTNPDQARAVMVHLSNFMRMNLKLMSSHLVSLEQELCLLESYIKIVQVRFAEQLTIDLDIEEDLTHFKLPPATIQPLVENSIQHGLKRVSKGGKVVISITRIEYGVQIRIQDNGSGIPKERLENLARKQIASKMGNGIGVFNVNQRLTALLGEKSQLNIRNVAEGGCEVSFLLPKLQPERSYY